MISNNTMPWLLSELTARSSVKMLRIDYTWVRDRRSEMKFKLKVIVKKDYGCALGLWWWRRSIYLCTAMTVLQ